MIFRGIVAFSIYLVLLLGPNGSVRIYFSKCGSGGFDCDTQLINGNGSTTLALSLVCPSDDITIFINQFRSPINIESLYIHNCKNLTLSFKCSDRRSFFQTLIVKNISVLKIDTQRYTSSLPTLVHLENISYMEKIANGTFSQTARSDSICGALKQDIKNVIIKNVTIDTIESNAIRMPNSCENFSMQEVKINRIQTSGILVKLDDGSKFVFEKSEIEVVEHLGIQVTGQRVTFSNNKFTDIASSAINGTIKDFTFTGNLVNTLQSYGISILCTKVRILHNKFEYLKSNAFEKIAPGLLEQSGVSFGNLKFFYEFKSNIINYMDAGSLHPDFLAYENVATDMLVEKNAMLCSCFNIGWIFPGKSHGHNSEYLDSFYELLLDKESENVCQSSCNLPLHVAAEIFREGKCPEYDTADLICTKTTNPIPTAPPPNIFRQNPKGNEMQDMMSTQSKPSSRSSLDLLLMVTILYTLIF